MREENNLSTKYLFNVNYSYLNDKLLFNLIEMQNEKLMAVAKLV